MKSRRNPAVRCSAWLGIWQPIDTHPRYQNLVLLTDGRKQLTGYYGGANSGWRTSDTASMWPEPTHWMPLPPLPNDPRSATGRKPVPNEGIK